GICMTSSGLNEYPQNVEVRNKTCLAVEKVLVPATREPERPAAEASDPKLNVSVVFTSVTGTLLALKVAGELASNLGARIMLFVPQVVPYPLPLESPPVLVEFNERRFRVIASESTVETRVQIYLCRDHLETLVSVLSPASLIVIGGRKRWWPTAERRL